MLWELNFKRVLYYFLVFADFYLRNWHVFVIPDFSPEKHFFQSWKVQIVVSVDSINISINIIILRCYLPVSFTFSHFFHVIFSFGSTKDQGDNNKNQVFMQLSQAKLIHQTHQENGFSIDCVYVVMTFDTTNEKTGIHHHLVYLFLQWPFIWNFDRSENSLKYFLLAICIYLLIISCFLCF